MPSIKKKNNFFYHRVYKVCVFFFKFRLEGARLQPGRLRPTLSAPLVLCLGEKQQSSFLCPQNSFWDFGKSFFIITADDSSVLPYVRTPKKVRLRVFLKAHWKQMTHFFPICRIVPCCPFKSSSTDALQCIKIPLKTKILRLLNVAALSLDVT